MNKFIVGILSLLFCLSHQMYAQELPEEDIIKRALKDEMQRNMQHLVLANQGKPFYMAYTYKQMMGFRLVAVSGGIVEDSYIPRQSNGFVKVLSGDYHRTSDLYPGRAFQLPLPIRADYDEIRRGFWLYTDAAYKSACLALTNKWNALKINPLSGDLDKLDDFSPLTDPKEVWQDIPDYGFNRSVCAAELKELSSIFDEYEEIISSSVQLQGESVVIYQLNSDGVWQRYPMNYVQFVAQGKVQTQDGVEVSDSYGCMVPLVGNLPDWTVLKDGIVRLAERLKKVSRENVVRNQNYSGPVLFEGAAAAQVFIKQLLYNGGLLAARQAEPDMPDLGLHLGDGIIDSRISVKHLSGLQHYQGQVLWGTYTMDAEGFTPASELVLINKGQLMTQMNGRVPTLQQPHSTGNARFCLNDRSHVYIVAPGIIEVSVDKGTKADDMKKALIKAAKRAKCSYAYIVRSFSEDGAKIYQVDLETGEESEIYGGYVMNFKMDKLENCLALSSKSNVYNYLFKNQVPSSLIYPSSILLNDIDIKVDAKSLKKSRIMLTPPSRR